MVPDRRAQDYREVRAGRQVAVIADLEAGRVGEETALVSLQIAGFSREEASEMVRIHKPFKTVGQVAAAIARRWPRC